MAVALFERRQFQNSATMKQKVQSPVCLGSSVTQIHTKVNLYPKHFYFMGKTENYFFCNLSRVWSLFFLIRTIWHWSRTYLGKTNKEYALASIILRTMSLCVLVQEKTKETSFTQILRIGRREDEEGQHQFLKNTFQGLRKLNKPNTTTWYLTVCGFFY